MKKLSSILSSVVCAAVLIQTINVVEFQQISAGSSSYGVIQPVANYDFSDSSNLGKDAMGNYDLNMQGAVSQGTKESNIKSAVFNGSSSLYASTVDGKDFIDTMDEFTISFWGQRDAVQANHSFMMGTGVAYSYTGLGLGFYGGNDAVIAVLGNVGGGDYAANYRFPNQTTKYNSSSVWNFYTLSVTKSGGSFYINGEQFVLSSVGTGGIDFANLTQTFTLGGVVNNDGSSLYNGFIGQLADVRVYDSALSNSQIGMLYNNGNGNTELVSDFIMPLAKYDFTDSSNLGKDAVGNFDLNLQGTVSQGTRDTNTKSAIFNGNSALYAGTSGGKDFTDMMDEFTISFWAQRDTAQANHTFMVGTGVAYSTTGLGIGYYSGNDALIAVCGNVNGGDYAANYRFPNETTKYTGSSVWNFYSVSVTKNGGYFYINGEQFALNSIGAGGIDFANLAQTFTLGGVVNNDGTSLHNGYIGQLSDVRVYDFALSNIQIGTLYNDGSGNTELSIQDSSETGIVSANDIDDPQVQIAEGSTKDTMLVKLNEQIITFQGSDGQTYSPDSVFWTDFDLTNTNYAVVTGILYKAGFNNAEGINVTVKLYYAQVNNTPDVIEPLVRYEFNDSNNLGKDSMGNTDLNMKGTVSQGTKDVNTKTAVFNGTSALVAPTMGNYDFSDYLEDFTITFWAKRNSVQNQHSFMVGSGVAYSATGFGLGYYAGNDAMIAVLGNVGGGNYAVNYRFPNETTKYQSSSEWNLYSLSVNKSSGYFFINGEQFALNSIDEGGISIANLGQTLTLGGIAGNDGSTFYNGYIGELADMRIYDFALSNSQINTIYNNGNGDAELSGENAGKLFIESANDIDDPSIIINSGSSPELILSTLNQQPIRFVASDGQTYTGSAIWESLDTSGTEYAIATGTVYKSGYINATGVTITVKLYYGRPSYIQVSTIFTDNMLLQRNAKVKVFGYGGNPLDSLVVSFAGQTKTASYTDDGWYVYLDPMEASVTGRSLTITYTKQGETEPSQTFTFHNTVVGEVFLASGQSNMELTLATMVNTDAGCLDDYSDITNWDKLRFYNQPYAASNTPSIYYDYPTTWKVPANVNDAYSYSGFALAYASQLQEKLGADVPVGVVVSAVGGSCIEEWLDADTMSGLQSTAASMGKVDSRFYNAMIHSFAGYTIGGVLWYQGKANARTPELYQEQFAAYADLYRELFENESLPIIYMQLPQFEDSLWPLFRQGQWGIMGLVDNTYAVCGIDLGNPDNIHPTDKYAFAARAVGVALKYIYAMDSVSLSSGTPYGLSPYITSAVKTPQSIVLSFSDAVTLTADGSADGLEGYNGNSWRELAVTLKGNQMVITGDIDDIQSIRYLFDTTFNDAVFVYNEYSLPVAPFAPYKVTSGLQQINAEKPLFEKNLLGNKTYKNGEKADSLTCSATVTDNGTISYQWYVSNENAANGTAVDGATSKTYTPPTNKTGVFYYYVVVKNTNNAVSGMKTSSATSNICQVTVENDTSPQVDTGEKLPLIPLGMLGVSLITITTLYIRRRKRAYLQ